MRDDGLRKTFKEMLIAETGAYDSYLKYGKAKGWPGVPPAFSVPK